MRNKTFYTSDALIDAVERKANIPNFQENISPEDILEFATEEMYVGVVPLVLSKQEDYYTVREVLLIEPGKTRYPISPRAIGAKMRNVLIRPVGADITQERPLHRLSLDDIYSKAYQNDYISNFYLENDEIVLLGEALSSTHELVVVFSMRPNALVLSKHVGKILNIDRTLGVITLSNFPDKFTLNQTYDFIQSRSPHRIYGIDSTPVDINSNSMTITFNPEDIPERLDTGDRVAFSEESDLVYCPSDLHSLLAQYTVTRVLEAIGDQPGLKSANDKLARVEMSTSALMNNRVDQALPKVRPKHGLLGRGSRTLRRNRMLRD